MGLDMYLHVGEMGMKNSEDFEMIGIWRKANQIRAFFASYVPEKEGENIDNLVLNLDMLNELESIIKDVLSDKSLAPDMLPTQSGFFFGSLEYDEGYFNDLTITLSFIDEAKVHLKAGKLVAYSEWW
ncbi:hypothetical protein R6Z02_14970 [Carnobacterium maltaromaticum]|uniref:hypothetical protein n=1 Tax=Carnobacterium maltaromaticum TaxID=2751 RepID=UPI00298A4180|nr:hypothetical protein [Carnobacterium maltaromaticum]MDW5525056.1 hypothetical protein [Carnobacterium maltaromaticum]